MKEIFAKKMDAFIERYCEEHLFSGVLRVTLKDNVILERKIGFADHAAKLPFTDDSMFTFYSLSKPLCAIGLMKLVDKGLVDLDSHPGKYIPEAAGFHPAVTVRHAMHHISGLPDFAQTESFAKLGLSGSPEELRERMLALTEHPMMFEPGTKGLYANINFNIPALIIENVTGMSYGEYMKKEVFGPLGMKTAVVDHAGLEIPHRVQGYVEENGALVPSGKPYDWMFGAGDIVGRVDDVYCLNLAYKHKLLLSEESWKQVLTPSPLNNMGLGNTITNWHGKYRITHNGGHIGFRTLHIHLPEDDFDIILLSNCGFGDARSDFAETVYEAWYGSSEA